DRRVDRDGARLGPPPERGVLLAVEGRRHDRLPGAVDPELARTHRATAGRCSNDQTLATRRTDSSHSPETSAGMIFSAPAPSGAMSQPPPSELSDERTTPLPAPLYLWSCQPVRSTTV